MMNFSICLLLNFLLESSSFRSPLFHHQLSFFSWIFHSLFSLSLNGKIDINCSLPSFLCLCPELLVSIHLLPSFPSFSLSLFFILSSSPFSSFLRFILFSLNLLIHFESFFSLTQDEVKCSSTVKTRSQSHHLIKKMNPSNLLLL